MEVCKISVLNDVNSRYAIKWCRCGNARFYIHLLLSRFQSVTAKRVNMLLSFIAEWKLNTIDLNI